MQIALYACKKILTVWCSYVRKCCYAPVSNFLYIFLNFASEEITLLSPSPAFPPRKNVI